MEDTLRNILLNNDNKFIFCLRRTGGKDYIKLSHDLDSILKSMCNDNIDKATLYINLEDERFCMINTRDSNIRVTTKNMLVSNDKNIARRLKAYIKSYIESYEEGAKHC